MLLCSVSYSQVLEETYTTDGFSDNDNRFSSFNIDGDIKYYTRDWSNSQVKIFDSSHNLEKTINLNLGDGYEMSQVHFPTDKLFNSDSKIEIIVSSRTYSPSFQQNYTVFNEDGDKIFEFSNIDWIELVKTPSNSYKLITYQDQYESGSYGNYSYSVYGLEGTLSVDQENWLSKVAIQYPNPATETINFKNLDNNLKGSTLEIYSMQGQKVFSEKINLINDEISLDISNLSKGVYVYKLGDLSNKFVKE
ncbi:T9SS type A sorting domain-containing protein [Algibacter lectus]|uniref:Secretion system C-terminal sorting domain-containing protein n=1 Tax=Algibacter lectus TaxID=221126 RepID=A0A090VAV1_9FLAO|nr:T9SS type A sorting domain-containing protein [Algibacter lectus]GAL61253.1 hypothetical protein JCM19300_4199 [Algibacter lectus]